MGHSDLQGPWSGPFGFARSRPPLGLPIGLYNTSVSYGGRTYPENHQVWVFADGVCVLGVPVVSPQWAPQTRTLRFQNQPNATRGGKPSSAFIVFSADGFAGECQFPGEGPVGWTGQKIAEAPVYGDWLTEVAFGGHWWAEDHRLKIAPGVVSVANIPVQWPILGGASLSFSDQTDASRGAMPWSASIAFADGGFTGQCQFPGEGPIPWRSRPSSPSFGTYKTQVSFGGQWWDEDHPVTISADGVTVNGLTVVNPVLTATSLAFSNQPGATRAGKPESGALAFEGGNCAGWCQFPGEGPIGWRGNLVLG